MVIIKGMSKDFVRILIKVGQDVAILREKTRFLMVAYWLEKCHTYSKNLSIKIDTIKYFW